MIGRICGAMAKPMDEALDEDENAPRMRLFSLSNDCDVLLLGKTGMGKSTLGNKLLQISTTPEDRLRLVEDTPKITAIHEDQQCLARENEPVQETMFCGSDRKDAKFRTADDVVLLNDRQSQKENLKLQLQSVTDACKLVANKNTHVRVLDTPGFSDSRHSSASLYEGNLQIFRWIVREQRDRGKNLKIRRVLYFFPERGVPEKADRGIQDELDLIHHFFGPDIFNCMVIIATNRKDERHQRIGFNEDDACDAQRVFKLSYELATGEELRKCPPVVYISVNHSEEEVVSKIKKAKVIQDKAFNPQFPDGVCSRCAIKYIRNSKNEGICLADDEHTAYDTTRCHPVFVPKYSTGEKVQGGLAHIATLGTALLYEVITKKETWPGFTNSDEICPSCKQSPGSKGCLQVKEKFLLPNGREITVEHTNEL